MQGSGEITLEISDVRIVSALSKHVCQELV